MILSISILGILCVLVIWFILSTKKSKHNYDDVYDDIVPRHIIKRKFVTLEESWKFLEDIKKIVLEKFSTIDRQEVLSIGSKLAIIGMMYQHVIEFAVKSIGVSNSKSDQLSNSSKQKSNVARSK